MTNGSVLLSQKKYARTVLARFQEFLPGKSNVPMDPTDGSKLSATMGPTTREGKAIMANLPYRQLLGSLMYLMVSTRPDVALAISRLSRFSQNPGMVHWRAALKIVAYVHTTQDVGMLYRRNAPVHLVGVTDAGFAGDPDERRSQGGYLYLLGGAAVSWKSYWISTVARSTPEAKYVAASDCAAEGIFLRSFLGELGFP